MLNTATEPLEARRVRPIMHAVDDLADIAHAGARGGVHLHNVNVAAFHDGGAMLALAARLCRRPACAVGPDTVHPLGDDPCGGGFASAADARHDEGLRDPIGGKRILEGADHRILPDQIHSIKQGRIKSKKRLKTLYDLF